MQNVTTYYLEMNSAAELKPKKAVEDLEIIECEIKDYQFNRFLYQLVGAQWNWVDKLSWSDEMWKNYAESENLRTWVAYVGGVPAGYFELQMQENQAVEIAYFGLAPKFIGQGFGGYLLTRAVELAWDWGAARVWLHTCSLDHPRALDNYKVRGFKLYRTEVK